MVAVFRVTGDDYSNGITAVKKILESEQAKVLSEVDMEDRSLAYPIKKETRGHYKLFNLSFKPERLIHLESQLKLVNELLRYLFVQKEGN